MINARVGTLVAAVHTLTVALLGTCAIAGMVRIERQARFYGYLSITAVLTIVVIGGARALFAGLLRPAYARDQVLAGMHLLRQPAPATVHTVLPAPGPAEKRPILQTVRERGVLRVGYMRDALPFSFFNAKGDLVGFDVELGHHLASELRVRAEFITINRARLARTRSPTTPATSSWLV